MTLLYIWWHICGLPSFFWLSMREWYGTPGPFCAKIKIIFYTCFCSYKERDKSEEDRKWGVTDRCSSYDRRRRCGWSRPNCTDSLLLVTHRWDTSLSRLWSTWRAHTHKSSVRQRKPHKQDSVKTIKSLTCKHSSLLASNPFHYLNNICGIMCQNVGILCWKRAENEKFVLMRRYCPVTRCKNSHHFVLNTDGPTHTLSAVTLRMSMTSHSPEVIGVAVPCINQSKQNMKNDVQLNQTRCFQSDTGRQPTLTTWWMCL